MKTVCVGLDVGSRTCAMAALDKETGDVITRRAFATSEKNLIAVTQELRGEVHVHLEASELAAWVRRTIKPHVARVVVSHPKSNAWIGQDPLKYDKRDAAKLAEMLRGQLLGSRELHEVFCSDDEDRNEFRRVVRHYEQITDQEAALKRAIKAELRKSGVIVRGIIAVGDEARKELLARVPSSAIRALLQHRYQLLDAALLAQKQAKKLMLALANRFGEIKRFQQMPGVGPILASRYAGGIQTPHRFATKRQLIRYCRLGIVWRESDGKRYRHQALDSNGCGSLKDVTRKAFMAALRSHDDNGIKRAYRRAVASTQDQVHARLTVQRKIAVALWAMWRDNKEYHDELMG